MADVSSLERCPHLREVSFMRSSIIRVYTLSHCHRRVAEAGEGAKDTTYSEAKSDVLSEISRKASIKKAKQLAEDTQQQYIIAERKARSEEETVRKIHQKQADKAMEVFQRVCIIPAFVVCVTPATTRQTIATS